MVTLTVCPVLEKAENTFEDGLLDNLFQYMPSSSHQKVNENPSLHHMQVKFFCNLIKSILPKAH